MHRDIKSISLIGVLILIILSIIGCNQQRGFDTEIPDDVIWIDHKDSNNYSLSGKAEVISKEDSKLDEKQDYVFYRIIIEKISSGPGEITFTAFLDDDFLAFFPNRAFLIFGTPVDMPVSLTEDVKKTTTSIVTFISLDELSDYRRQRLREIIMNSDVKIKISDGDTSEYLVLPAEDIEFDVSVLEEDSDS